MAHILTGHVGVRMTVMWLLLQFLMGVDLLRDDVMLIRF